MQDVYFCSYIRLLLVLKFFWQNDMIGPSGFGEARFISVQDPLNYKIRFENAANASAPAQRVIIRHKLDNDLDLRSFRVGSFGFGNFTREILEGKAFLQVRNHRPLDCE